MVEFFGAKLIEVEEVAKPYEKESGNLKLIKKIKIIFKKK